MELNDIEEVVSEIKENTRLKDLIEFSKAVHAEMDAIIGIARNSSASTENSQLFTTAFPCHNCTRHIIVAGIKEVYYIEPYEKSLATELHGDSILIEPLDEKTPDHKVIFQHFEGVAPKQYLNLFKAVSDRKKKGKLVKTNLRTANPIIPEYLDTYKDYEAKVIKHLEENIKKDHPK